MSFEKNVFINCPYDEDFLDLLRPLLFTVIFLKLKPRIASASMDSGQERFLKIQKLISESKYSIHDLSRLQAASAGEMYRLNMPLELGLDMGSRRFGPRRLREKRFLVLETEKHRYAQAMSDFAGFDIRTHGDEPRNMVLEVRRWLNDELDLKAKSGEAIWKRFNAFMAEDYDALREADYSEDEIRGLSAKELMGRMEDWVNRSASPE